MYPVNYRQIKRAIDHSTDANFLLLCKRGGFTLNKSPKQEYAVNMLQHGSWDVWAFGATPQEAYQKACSFVRFQKQCIQNSRFPLELAHKIDKAKKEAHNGNL